MRRLAILAALAALLAAPASAQGAFGINSFDVTFTGADGTPANTAGSHPFAVTTSLQANLDSPEGTPEGWVRDLLFEQVPGLIGDTTAYRRCTNAQFLEVEGQLSACPNETAVGITGVSANEFGSWYVAPVFNLTPPPGVALRLGFTVAQANVVIDVGLSHNPPYNATAASRNTSQVVEFIAAKTQLWGNPSDPLHDELRGACGLDEGVPAGDVSEFEFEGQGKTCPVDPVSKPLLSLPTYCGAPLLSRFEAISWEGERDSGSRAVHDAGGNPVPFSGCDSLPPFNPSISAAPTSTAASSPTGLDLRIGFRDEGLTSVTGRSQSRLREVRLTLPEGMTANPSVAEGLGVCSEAELGRETVGSAPGEGCPQASKIGTVEVQTPLVEEPLTGALYQATPYANLAGNSLIALYVVIKNPKLGIIVKQATRVEADPRTGRLTGIAEDVPPSAVFSSFRLRFREGGRSPLITPPGCGRHEVSAELVPWSGAATVTRSSSFEVASGPGGGPCPAGRPFAPGFEAASLNNAAGRHTPFAMRLTRSDGDQDLTRFDATLPPGLTAKLAGVSRCTDAQIAQAKQKSGRTELALPSCPAGSRIGTIRSGAGVGSQLTYVNGTLHLAGPFAGAPLSAVAIVPAVAGPFDVGTVVVRQALRVHPRTGEVSADGAASDPLPHILAGIPLAVRDVQVLVDRPGFTLNPTSCDRFATAAQIWGGGADPFSIADNSPVPKSAPFQASGCQRLGFKPRLAMRLKGGTRRGANPALRGVLRPRAGDANLRRLLVRLPRSAFLDQAHIRTICTRVQFAAERCPKAAIYGRARVFTPLLAAPLEGPVYLRSSNHNLPDFVADLHGLIEIEAVARIDSIKGGIRATFTDLPDAPLTRAVIAMQGGRKGLIVNSTNLCAAKHRANARLDSQSAKRKVLRPVVRAAGCKKPKRARSSHRRVG